MNKTYFTPKEASKYLGCAPYTLNVEAREGTLPFPYMFAGNRLKIFKKPFLEYIGAAEERTEKKE